MDFYLIFEINSVNFKTQSYLMFIYVQLELDLLITYQCTIAAEANVHCCCEDYRRVLRA